MSVATESGPAWNERFQSAVANFSQSNHDSVRAVRSLLSESPEDFSQAASGLLASPWKSEAHRFVAMLLARNDLALPLLTRSDALSVDEAVRIARRILPFEPSLERKLVRILQNEAAAAPQFERILEIVAAITPVERLEAVLTPLLHHPHPEVRAAVIPLLASRAGSLALAFESASDPDPRIRAAAIRALWGAKSAAVDALLERAGADLHPAVRANVLIARHKRGDAGSLSDLVRMASHEDEAFRLAAANAMGLTADTRFTPSLRRLLRDPHPAVRSQAIQSLAQIKRASTRHAHAAALRIRVLDAIHSQGQATLWVEVLTEQGDRVDGLLPAQFALWGGAQPLLDYHAWEAGGAGRLAVGFGLWHSLGMSEELWRAAEQGIEACFDLKTPRHSWSVIKVSKRDEDLAGAPDLPAHESLLTQPEPMRDTALSLIATASSVAAARHVVLLVQPDTVDEGSVETILENAARHHTLVHAIACAPVPESNPLQLFAQPGAGSLRVATQPAELTAAYQEVYRSFLTCYEIGFRSDGPEPPADLRLEVDCERGFGSQPVEFR